MQPVDSQTQINRKTKERENGGNQPTERKDEREGGKRMDGKRRPKGNGYQKTRDSKGKRENQ
jgi:hypothetical protein